MGASQFSTFRANFGFFSFFETNCALQIFHDGGMIRGFRHFEFYREGKAQLVRVISNMIDSMDKLLFSRGQLAVSVRPSVGPCVGPSQF